MHVAYKQDLLWHAPLITQATLAYAELLQVTTVFAAITERCTLTALRGGTQCVLVRNATPGMCKVHLQ